MTKPRIPTAEQRTEAERLLAEHGEQAQEEREADEERRRQQRATDPAIPSDPRRP